jgi:phosphoribulokinase
MQRPIMLGIVGDSAAGKSTLTRGIADILGPDRVTHICTDDYHRYDRRERAHIGITPLHPECNYLDVLELHLDRLRAGLPILKPVYDHSDGTLRRPEYVVASGFVIAEGLLAFHTGRMRDCFDVKVYLDPPEELRHRWKVKRDVAKRGYTVEQVTEELRKREPDSRDFIRPQRAHADIVVGFSPPEGAPLGEDNGHLNARLVLRPTIPHPNLSDVLDPPGRPPDPSWAGIRLELGRDSGLPVDFLEIDGNVSPERAAALCEILWDLMPETHHRRSGMIGIYLDGHEPRRSDPLGLAQLLVTYHMLRAARAD